MGYNLKRIIDKEKGKTCIVLASGPSLTPIIPNLRSYKDNGEMVLYVLNQVKYL